MLLTALTAAALAAPQTTVHSWTASATASVIHLALPSLRPTVELTGEFKLGPRYSVAAIGGVGFNSGVSGMGGGQVLWYALGDFRGGLQLGAELYGLGGQHESGNLYSLYTGGPVVGGKYIFDPGLTLSAQLGLAYARSLERDGEVYLIQKGFLLLPGVQVGWSFGPGKRSSAE